jgi:CheY-like chemotaxis protein
MADDNPDDFYLVKDALEENSLSCDLRLVSDGKELLNYLYQMGAYAKPGEAPQPELILMYMHTSENDGWKTIAAIKSDPSLRWIPIVVVNGSKKPEDITRCYDIGASSYISIPETFESLVDVIGTMGKYWMAVVKLPGYDWQADAHTLQETGMM